MKRLIPVSFPMDFLNIIEFYTKNYAFENSQKELTYVFTVWSTTADGPITNNKENRELVRKK